MPAESWKLSINDAWPPWLAEALLKGRVRSADPRRAAGHAGMVVKTPSGESTARPGDWIVHVEGELTVVPAETFEQTHEAAQ